VFGILLHSAGLDAVGYWLLRSRRPLALFAWANICFVTFLAFFTPKLNNFPTWLFLILGGFSALLAGLATRPPGAANSREAYLA
jgi:hypothetical protein